MTGVTSRGNVKLVLSCNSQTNSIFVTATYTMSCPNLSITDEFLSYFGVVKLCTRVLELGGGGRGHIKE